ncbi:DUF559 domain-containing protein [Haemophilus influenzae]|nr:DUF559 domain-containing protein [Haemophilus influenzae]MCK8928262.1 DUF559 domain-containing protein [Haemophilus influenzae]MCK8953092.1 DUF559 domain-containing protein [Haemophilus influenzae]
MQPYEKYLKLNSQKLRVEQTDAERKLWQRINRDAELNSLGFTVMRFSNNEVMREIEAVVEQIYLFLENVRAD